MIGRPRRRRRTPDELAVLELRSVRAVRRDVGLRYTLVAIGIVLCASATNVINFAQGEFVMPGGLVGAHAHWREYRRRLLCSRRW